MKELWVGVAVIVVCVVLLPAAMILAIFYFSFLGIASAVLSRWFWCIALAIAGAWWLGT